MPLRLLSSIYSVTFLQCMVWPLQCCVVMFPSLFCLEGTVKHSVVLRLLTGGHKAMAVNMLKLISGADSYR
jgi:hypothetical protein